MTDARGLNLLQRLSAPSRRGATTPAESLTLAIEALLQSRRLSIPARWQPSSELGKTNSVGASVLNYGIPPVENWRLANDLHQVALETEVERALEIFEPRIRVLDVVVKVADSGSQDRTGSDPGTWNDQILLTIHAEWRETGARVELEAGWGIEEHRVWFRRSQK
jgi:predicted component of type VI protein secretion system